MGLHTRVNSILRWSMGGKTHPFHIVGNTKLTFEELTYSVITQIEACLNSHPLGIIPNNNDDGIEVLTPGHFLMGRPIEALPADHESSRQSLSMLCHWYLCESLVRDFWNRWSNENQIELRKYSKWCQPTKNLCIGDIVVLRELSGHLGTSLKHMHEGKDGLVRIIKLNTKDGIYTQPCSHNLLLLPCGILVSYVIRCIII